MVVVTAPASAPAIAFLMATVESRWPVGSAPNVVTSKTFPTGAGPDPPAGAVVVDSGSVVVGAVTVVGVDATVVPGAVVSGGTDTALEADPHAARSTAAAIPIKHAAGRRVGGVVLMVRSRSGRTPRWR
jgi:hypothetical protein